MLAVQYWAPHATRIANSVMIQAKMSIEVPEASQVVSQPSQQCVRREIEVDTGV